MLVITRSMLKCPGEDPDICQQGWDDGLIADLLDSASSVHPMGSCKDKCKRVIGVTDLMCSPNAPFLKDTLFDNYVKNYRYFI